MFDVALDISFLGSLGGFGTYTRDLLAALVRRGADRRVLLIHNGLPRRIPQYRELEERARERTPPLPDHWRVAQTRIPNRPLWSQTALPRLLRKNGARVFHAVDSVSVPWLRAGWRGIVTIHDVIPLVHPEFSRGRDALGSKLLIPMAARRADCIVTDSRYSEARIREQFPRLSTPIEMIYPGVCRERFFPPENRAEAAERARAEFGLRTPDYILCVATLNPRRNLKRFLSAWKRCAKEPAGRGLCLAIAGSRGWNDEDLLESIRKPGLRERVHLLERVDDGQLVRLYQGALAVAVPSIVEGFGFPAAEAMASGAPLLCSNTSSLREIAAGAGLLFDPFSIDSMADAIHAIVENESLRLELAGKGLRRAEDFSWDRTADKLLELYERCR